MRQQKCHTQIDTVRTIAPKIERLCRPKFLGIILSGICLAIWFLTLVLRNIIFFKGRTPVYHSQLKLLLLECRSSWQHLHFKNYSCITSVLTNQLLLDQQIVQQAPHQKVKRPRYGNIVTANIYIYIEDHGYGVS